MSFDPIDFYYLANKLYEDNKTQNHECLSRSVISRAYYGAFIAARDKASVSDKSHSAHSTVYQFYFNNLNTKNLANQLNELRILRNTADYDMNEKLTSLQSGKALKWARAILLKLNCDLSVQTEHQSNSGTLPLQNP